MNERMRAKILAGVFAGAFLILIISYNIFPEKYLRFFPQPFIVPLFLFVASIAVYELALFFGLGIWIRRRGGVPGPLRYWNAFIEASMPTVIIMIAMQYIAPVAVLQSPASLLYFIFIVLSTLRLEFTLCVFTSAVAAIEYAATAFVFVVSAPESGWDPLITSGFYYIAKGLIFLLAGAAAGFVTLQIKHRVKTSLQMLEEAHKMKDLFGQQVSLEIADELLKQGRDVQSKRMHVCVMFLDIRDFTPLVEKKPPEQIVAYLNALFSTIIEIINRNHGIINQFLGDGFMATFGAPVPVGNNSRNAVDTALQILEATGAMAGNGTIPPTRLGIGLHTGEAVTGNVGSSIRMQYSITGSVVVLASRIEQLNKQYDSQLLVSEEVLRSAERDELSPVALGPVHVKGHESPINIYRLA
ncbi:MAG: adenylate/guanylate cyclase domain-containing protein [Ignavibacteria bacterium]|nr:adenylate/guanylate cyclase domain-containing protein [Ignavibacteria bacterium]